MILITLLLGKYFFKYKSNRNEKIHYFISISSDDGNFFIWNRKTNLIVDIFHADEAIVNCVQAHPNICMLATSGIDHEVRLWSPQSKVSDEFGGR